MDDLDELLGTFGAVLAGVAARRVLSKVYEGRRDHAPPQDPSNDGTGWREALLWGAVSGMVVGMFKVVGRRASSEALGRARG